jgi:hypothetical protein
VVSHVFLVWGAGGLGLLRLSEGRSPFDRRSSEVQLSGWVWAYSPFSTPAVV